MAYYNHHIIGIQTGGVFSADIDFASFKADVKKVIEGLMETTEYNDGSVDVRFGPFEPGCELLDHCLSSELTATKGSFVVIAGVFNYWSFESAEILCQALSKSFETIVLHVHFDWQESCSKHSVYSNGHKEEY